MLQLWNHSLLIDIAKKYNAMYCTLFQCLFRAVDRGLCSKPDIIYEMAKSGGIEGGICKA